MKGTKFVLVATVALWVFCGSVSLRPAAAGTEQGVHVLPPMVVKAYPLQEPQAVSFSSRMLGLIQAVSSGTVQEWITRSPTGITSVVVGSPAYDTDRTTPYGLILLVP